MHQYQGIFYERDKMRYVITLMMMLLATLMTHACYSSKSTGGADIGADAADDPLMDDVGVDVPIDDVGVEDVADAGSDEVPQPAGYSLHEWGVVVVDESGASVHGPSPLCPDIIDAKPVIYLYADEEIGPVSVGISFASGSATEVWPQVPLGSRISWNDLIVRPGPCDLTPFPIPWEDDPWYDGLCEACNLESCLVDDAACLVFNDAGGETVFSKLLFYTGTLPEYEPPLDATFRIINEPGFIDRLGVEITNDSRYDISDIWFIYRRTEDRCIDPSACPVAAAEIAFAFVDEVSSGASFSTSVDINRYEAEVDEEGFPTGDLPLPREWLDLGKDLLAGLVEKGLTESEAAAFLRNWETAFFGLLGTDSYFIEPFYSNGAFIIYFMDSADYDYQQPLTADPPPDESVRVSMVYQKLSFCAFNMRYCERSDDCVPVGCECHCSGCGFSYEDIMNINCVDAWYEDHDCEPPTECPTVCCSWETVDCVDNTCIVKYEMP